MPILFYEIGSYVKEWRRFVTETLDVSVLEKPEYLLLVIERHDKRRPDDGDVAAAFARFVPPDVKMVETWIEQGLQLGGPGVRRFKSEQG